MLPNFISLHTSPILEDCFNCELCNCTLTNADIAARGNSKGENFAICTLISCCTTVCS